MATLRGHSRPVKIEFLEYVLDHTYVTCGAGQCWPCWGDCLDGVVLKTGEGSSAMAHQLSEPNSWAGIVYGITGLCHQTSNRILWPAGITVGDSTGYGITHFFFGDYGSDAFGWALRRDASKAIAGEIDKCTGPESPVVDPVGKADAEGFTESTNLYDVAAAREEEERWPSGTPDPVLLASLLEQRVQQVLGSGFAGHQIADMQEVQLGCIREKTELDQALLGGGISGLEFAGRANGRINHALRNVASILEARDYVALFQMRPNAEITVIRPDICEAVYDRDRGAQS